MGQFQFMIIVYGVEGSFPNLQSQSEQASNQLQTCPFAPPPIFQKLRVTYIITSGLNC